MPRPFIKCWRQTGKTHCGRPYVEHGIEGQCPGGGGKVFKSHSPTNTRCGNSFTEKQARVMKELCFTVMRGGRPEPDWVKRNARELAALGLKGHNMIERISEKRRARNAEATRKLGGAGVTQAADAAAVEPVASSAAE